MTFKPLGKNILCDEDKKENKTQGGLILTEGTGESPTATVIAVGPDVKYVKVGDTIIVASGQKTIIEDREGIMTNEDEVIAIIDK